MKQIYFVREVGTQGPIKIGCTSAIKPRLTQLQSDMRLTLEVIATADGDYCAEAALHRQFAHLQTVVAQASRKGPVPGATEWFTAAPELLALISRVASTGVLPPPPESDKIMQMAVAYNSGQTLREIGERFGISCERVRQLLRKHGVESLGWRAETRKMSITAKNAETVKLLASRGATVTDIARQIGDAHCNVRNFLMRKDIKVPRGKKGFSPKTITTAHAVAKDYLAGVKGSEIAQRHGIQQPHIYRLLRIAGVEVCRRGKAA